LVFDLVSAHSHGLVFHVLILGSSRNQLRAQAAADTIERLKSARREICEEVELIRFSLLRAAVTWSERVLQRIADAYDHFQRRNFTRMAEALRSILMLVERPLCEMHHQFLRQYQRNLAQLDPLLRAFNAENPAIGQLSQWCKTIQAAISEEIKQIKSIQLAAISPELSAKSNFALAVPGTYVPNKPVVRILYFVGQLSVHMSKQQPKNVILRGEDGHFYQYLLKGHEDLRLDERIMQFFRLINSLMMKDAVFNGNVIHTVNVIPLSISHGLVQWATGTDTLRSAVEQWRKLHDVDPLREYTLVEQMCSETFDFLQPIQKLHILERVFSEVPDSDIADYFWLKAGNAEKWWKQTTQFSRSNAQLSIVGYMIGLGDRHPSNLLIDKTSGRVVHIDFGDCFERAANRKYLPEVVPFRLTRMMVRALGVGGINGLFRSAFIDMGNMLHANSQVLEMVLLIFVQEPLVYPDSENDGIDLGIEAAEGNVVPLTAGRISKAPTGSVIDVGRVYMTDTGAMPSMQKMRDRIREKLTGGECGHGRALTLEEQTTWLIESATNPYNLAKMYSGWCPFW
jgi:phosphatidylinositol kinase/protein kinase (PI-3  family)